MAILKDLIVNTVSRFIGKVFINESEINKINNATVGNNPKFTDTTDLGSMTGTLSPQKGGTGLSKPSTTDLTISLINSLDTATGAPNDDTYYISQNNNAGYNTYYRRPASKIWEYIKGKIDANGSYTNKNTFSNVKVGSSTIAADTTTDTLELAGSGRVTLTSDTTNDKITINVPDTIPAQQVTWQNAGTDNTGTSMTHTENAFGATVINPILRANRFSGLRAAGITIEYSRDSGTTWIPYNATEMDKRALFTDGSRWDPSFRIGNDADGGSRGQAAGVCRLRIIIDTSEGNVYTSLRAFHLNISTEASNEPQVTITAALASDPTNYSLTICSNRILSGFSGWNLIPCNFTTYGYKSASQYQKIKFEFFDNGNTHARYKGLNVLKILGYGGAGWNTPTLAAKNNDICFKDFIQGQIEPRAYFSNGVQTTNFYGTNLNLTGQVNNFAVSNVTMNTFGRCTTPAATSTKEVTVTTPFSLVDGARITVLFDNKNTSLVPYLNVNNTGANSIWSNWTQVSSVNNNIDILFGVVQFIYITDRWHIIGGVGR